MKTSGFFQAAATAAVTALLIVIIVVVNLRNPCIVSNHASCLVVLTLIGEFILEWVEG